MTRKRIPQIKLPDIDETSHLILGTKILFIGLRRDESPSNPLEDQDGIGSIDTVSTHNYGDKTRESVIGSLWDDRDAVAIRIRDGYEHIYQPHRDEDEIYAEICAIRLRKRIAGEDPDDWGILGLDEKDWYDKVDAVWIPDNCVRESYTGQDGLTRRQWMVNQAKAACETYTDYVNGNVYGFDVRMYAIRKDDMNEIITDRDYYDHHKVIEEDSCWGFYGWDYFKEEVLGVVKGFLKDQKFSRRAIDAAIKEAA